MLRRLLALSALWCLAVTSTEEDDLLWVDEERREVTVGDSVTLVCRVKVPWENPVLWIKVNMQDSERDILAHNDKLLVMDSRLEVKHNNGTAARMSLLKIKDVKLSDSGSYRCQVPVTNSTSTINASVEVRVLEVKNEEKLQSTPSRGVSSKRVPETIFSWIVASCVILVTIMSVERFANS